MKSFHIKSEAVKLLRDFLIMVGSCIVALLWLFIVLVVLVLMIPLLPIIAIIIVFEELFMGDKYV